MSNNSEQFIPDKTKFKNASGSWLLKPIFFELDDAEKTKAVYSLKPEDHTSKGVTYPSLRRLYLECGDDTEYYFAETYFGGWPHWKKLTACNWFVDYLSDIREELRAKQAADSKRRIREIAQNKSNKGSLQANRLLLGETRKSDNPVGRPSKDSINRRAREIADDQAQLQEDLERITASIGTFR